MGADEKARYAKELEEYEPPQWVQAAVKKAASDNAAVHRTSSFPQ